MALNLIIINQTSNNLSYLNGAITIDPMGDYTATATTIFPLSRDPQLLYDCNASNAYLSDTVNIYTPTSIPLNSIAYLNLIANSLGGQVVGYLGASAPSFAIMVGAQDVNGDAQNFRMNQFNDLATNYRNTYLNITGNTTTIVKASSGTLHGLLVNNNATAGKIQIYDNNSASGTLIGTFTLGSAVTAAGPIFLGPLGLEFKTGLTVVTSVSTSNNITIIYQ